MWISCEQIITSMVRPLLFIYMSFYFCVVRSVLESSFIIEKKHSTQLAQSASLKLRQGRHLLQTCSANSYSNSGSCYDCPANSTSPAGSTVYSACTCTTPKYLSAYSIIFGKSGNLGTDSVNYGGSPRIFIILNYIFPKFSPKVGTVITSWTVTTVKACTIQPFFTVAGSDYFWDNPSGGQQNYYIDKVTHPVVIPAAGTYTFPWTIPTVRGGNVLGSALSMSLGWYDVSGSGNCIATFKSASAALQMNSFPPKTPNIWADAYYNNYAGTRADVALQIISAPAAGDVPVMTCKDCDANSYRSSSTTCATCPGNSTSAAGSISFSDCKCRVGFFMQGSVCIRCSSVGSYCMVGATSLNQCQAGFYCATPELQVQCPANHYCPVSSTAPIQCDANKVSQPGSTSVSQCEVNSITVNFEVNGADPTLSQSQFQNALPSNIVVDSYVDVIVSAQRVCPTGYYCPADTTTPIPCPAGTYNNFTNKVAVGDCVVCPVGQYCTINSTLPVDCAAGSYRIVEGATKQADCTVCPAGNYCPIKSITPENCTVGTYNPSTGGDDISDCLACLAGNFCPLAATVTPTACRAGTYRGAVGGVDQESCTSCPPGNFCPLASVNPTNCSAGSYRGTDGGVAQSSCTSCPAGNF